MRDLLSRGIAVHHGGLLPIVKEVGFSALINTVRLSIAVVGGGTFVCPRTREGPVCDRDICHGKSKIKLFIPFSCPGGLGF